MFLWPDTPVKWIHTEAMAGWVLLRVFCKHHGPTPCPCDYRIGTPIDEFFRQNEQAEIEEIYRLQTEDTDIAAVLPW